MASVTANGMIQMMSIIRISPGPSEPKFIRASRAGQVVVGLPVDCAPIEAVLQRRLAAAQGVLPPVERGELCLGKRVAVQVEPDVRRRRIRRNVELVCVEGEDGEVIVVWLVASRWTRTAVARRAEVGVALRSARRQ